MIGTIFDIQRNALHDGRGIRTVVFLKGCPFSCVWCCNPESIDPRPQLGYLENFCEHCGACVDKCARKVFNIKSGKLAVDFAACVACGACIDACPYNALKIYGKKMDSDDVIREVLKDRAYFDATGGGLTLSGGDPLYQLDFAVELLRKAKKEGLHTTIETEGYYGKEEFAEVLKYVDYLFLDYKITNPSDHLKYTGVERDRVMKTLDYVASYGVKITVRCIITPGINDNDDHFKTIAELSRKYHNVEKIEIMPYHEFGKNKYYTIGRKPFEVESGSVPREVAEGWLSRIKNFGGKNICIG